MFHAFTLIEILVVVVLMSFIILALMGVFNATQTAFRASLTQADVLEGGRSVMGLIKSDLEGMTPSFGVSNSAVGAAGAVNFYSSVTTYPSPPSPLFQPLVGTSGGQQRTNVLENFFILSRANLNGQDSWIGTGYAVATNLPNGQFSLYSLYRYTTNHPVSGHDPAQIFNTDFFKTDFANFFSAPTNGGSHLMDGVVHLTVRAYDPGGHWMTNLPTYYYDPVFGQWTNDLSKNVLFLQLAWGEFGFYMFSNTLPASVEINLGVLEDRVLQRAESIGDPTAQAKYLAQQAGQVHVFRQRVWIRNVDPSAYQ
jgi:type II secretory pathway pseudopilin PulG